LWRVVERRSAFMRVHCPRYAPAQQPRRAARLPIDCQPLLAPRWNDPRAAVVRAWPPLCNSLPFMTPDRRRAPRAQGIEKQIWLAPPFERWAELIDRSLRGLRLRLPADTTLALGDRVTLRSPRGHRWSPARVAVVVRVEGDVVAVELRAAEPAGMAADRRAAPRVQVRARGVRAWILGDVFTPSTIIDLSGTGAQLAPLLPLKRGQRIAVELSCCATIICVRHAVVRRADEWTAGVEFLPPPRLANGAP
jgi:hypothetical protein